LIYGLSGRVYRFLAEILFLVLFGGFPFLVAEKFHYFVGLCYNSSEFETKTPIGAQPSVSLIQTVDM